MCAAEASFGAASFDAVVFDMGGVLVELGPLTDLLGDDPLPTDVFWSKWLASPTVRAFEMGECSVVDFGDELVAELGLSFPGAELVERFRTWPRGLFPGAAGLIATVRPQATVAVLSNTNELHWSSQVDHDEVRALFDRSYLSFELGLAKPDTDIFEHVVADLDVLAERILFLDDNQVNVDGARSVGIRAELARGVDEARSCLEAVGLMS